MLAIRKLWNAEINSRGLRAILGRCYEPGQVYTIPFGPLRGFRLRYDVSINYHAMLGLWELNNFRLLSKLLRAGDLVAPDATACDLGANIGLFSIWLARQSVPAGKVFAFEPAPDTLETLRDTISLNNLANVEAVPVACTDRIGPVEFFIGFHHHCSSLNSTWASGGDQSAVKKVVVEGTTLDAFFADTPAHKMPALIKIDIEGGAVQALQGCERCVETTRPLILAESHNPNEDQAFGRLLVSHDYKAFRLNNRRWITAPTDVHPHPDGVWGNLLICPRERHRTIAGLLS